MTQNVLATSRQAVSLGPAWLLLLVLMLLLSNSALRSRLTQDFNQKAAVAGWRRTP